MKKTSLFASFLTIIFIVNFSALGSQKNKNSKNQRILASLFQFKNPSSKNMQLPLQITNYKKKKSQGYLIKPIDPPNQFYYKLTGHGLFITPGSYRDSVEDPLNILFNNRELGHGTIGDNIIENNGELYQIKDDEDIIVNDTGNYKSQYGMDTMAEKNIREMIRDGMI